MKLYHGSNMEVRAPDLSYSRASLDFGKGFYLTPDPRQTGKWARHVTRFRRAGERDIITGPIANDRTVNVINQYIAGAFPEEIALQLLLPFKLANQWAMKTEKAFAALTWQEAQRP